VLREKVQDIIALAEHPAEVKLGLWFHDAIYDTRRHDSEEGSATWARSAARELGASAETAQRIDDLIMFTAPRRRAGQHRRAGSR
jgi:predicted metal-dependent HD superfamily phosphohydrolase